MREDFPTLGRPTTASFDRDPSELTNERGGQEGFGDFDHFRDIAAVLRADADRVLETEARELGVKNRDACPRRPC